jgi:hypothetical protein
MLNSSDIQSVRQWSSFLSGGGCRTRCASAARSLSAPSCISVCSTCWCSTESARWVSSAWALVEALAALSLAECDTGLPACPLRGGVWKGSGGFTGVCRSSSSRVRRSTSLASESRSGERERRWEESVHRPRRDAWFSHVLCRARRKHALSERRENYPPEHAASSSPWGEPPAPVSAAPL